MEDPYGVPEQAIGAFEATTGLSVSVHDLSGHLHRHLRPVRFQHFTPWCLAAKARAQNLCSAFDMDRVRPACAERPEGLVKVCHAGLVEWTVPVLTDARLDWVLFAGQRIAGKSLAGALLDEHPGRTKPWGPKEKLPAIVEQDEAQRLLEMLRQLAARLSLWRRTSEAATPSGAKAVPPRDPTTRRAAIRRFIETRHRRSVRLEDLAAYLHLSASRAGHAVREACGQPFIELLTEARLKTAAGLLEHSNLSVLEVAERSGFGDLSNFHAAFKKRYGTTPHRFRRKAEGGVTV